MRSLAKALSLLDHFSDLQPQIGLSAFRRLTGHDKATLHRHLQALTEAGLLEQDGDSRAYSLGPRIDRLAALRGKQGGGRVPVAATVDTLSRRIGEMVHLSQVRDDTLHTIHRADFGQHAMRVGLPADWPLPWGTSSSGKAVLAFSAPALTAARLDALDMRAAQKDNLRRELRRIADQGFARSCDTVEVGVSSCAIPVFGADGLARGACSIAFPTLRGTPDLLARAASLLAEAGPGLTHGMGGTVPDHVRQAWRRTTAPQPQRIRA
ncbi:IclR family transcriptional regulator [Pseudaestuariivita atlantica]|uniref:IclR family transcriptional regulator n=1 Tax=Pseudaestuariivita atlantica TaxID=1317121 RepID=A0A0L1JT03_9RHOB|nr:helix-turn-helix domain-containing protein [Pseudaestuariivita atlantica]KNG94891.1 hypothetical protein ATO11_05840 [Pseudaestuariivita atlantica]